MQAGDDSYLESTEEDSENSFSVAYEDQDGNYARKSVIEAVSLGLSSP